MLLSDYLSSYLKWDTIKKKNKKNHRWEISMDIVVLAGGLSGERDVSLKTGGMVAQALRGNGHRVVLLDVFLGCQGEEADISEIFADSKGVVQTADIAETAPDLEQVRAARRGVADGYFGPNVLRACRMADIVFLALHGEDGENGKIQAAFDLLGIRYTGSGYFGSALAMNKDVAKRFFRENGIPVPNGIRMENSGRTEDLKKAGVRLPCVVKPCCGGSSIGVSIVRTEKEFVQALEEAFLWEDEVVIEDYIEGRDFSVGVLDGKALPVIEIAPIQGFYDYKNKYKAGNAVETCPAELPEAVAEQMMQYAKDAAQALGLLAYSRMDFRLSADGGIYCLEANTLPGMTATSLLPQEAKAVGIDYAELCERIIRVSLRKYEG